jgi:hypothetical protein
VQLVGETRRVAGLNEKLLAIAPRQADWCELVWALKERFIKLHRGTRKTFGNWRF